MSDGVTFLAAFVAVVVIANVLARRRKAARRTAATGFARSRGFEPASDVNPFFGTYTPVPPPAGVGVSPPRPRVLEALASGRGTVQNVLRRKAADGEVIVLDYRMPPDGDGGSGLFVTWAAFRVPAVPTFELFPRPRFAIGMTFLEFDASPGFSRRWALRAADEGEARRSFTPAVLAACEALPAGRDWQLGGGGGWLFATFGKAGADLDVLVDAGGRVAAALRASSPANESRSP